MKKLLIFFALTIFCSTQSANATENQYDCTVEDVSVTPRGNNAEFIAKNLRKKFMITVTEKTIYVSVLSSDYKNSQTIYTIVNKDRIFGISATSINSLGMIEALIIDEDEGEATVLNQGSSFVNVWILNCQKT